MSLEVLRPVAVDKHHSKDESINTATERFDLKRRYHQNCGKSIGGSASRLPVAESDE